MLLLVTAGYYLVLGVLGGTGVHPSAQLYQAVPSSKMQ